MGASRWLRRQPACHPAEQRRQLKALRRQHQLTIASVEHQLVLFLVASLLPVLILPWANSDGTPLERVMVPGVAFVLDPRTSKVRPGLQQMRHLVGISTYGSPRSYVRLINDNGRRTITRALRLSCGLRVRSAWLGLYAIDTSTTSQRTAFLDRVEQRMAKLR